MSYCKLGDEPTVNYSFADGKHGSYQSIKSPIDIILKPYNPEFSGGQCKCMIYIITATVVQTNRQPFEVSNRVYGELIKFDVTRRPESEIFANGDPNECQANFLVLCRGFPLSGFGCRNQYEWVSIWNNLNCTLDIDFINIRITPENPNQPDNCGDLKKAVQIIVSHQGQEIFSDYGNAPVSFSVACQGCPEGTIRCESIGYPGYCCLPCDEIKLEINAIRSMVRRVKNG